MHRKRSHRCRLPSCALWDVHCRLGLRTLAAFGYSQGIVLGDASIVLRKASASVCATAALTYHMFYNTEATVSRRARTLYPCLSGDQHLRSGAVASEQAPLQGACAPATRQDTNDSYLQSAMRDAPLYAGHTWRLCELSFWASWRYLRAFHFYI